MVVYQCVKATHGLMCSDLVPSERHTAQFVAIESRTLKKRGSFACHTGSGCGDHTDEHRHSEII